MHNNSFTLNVHLSFHNYCLCLQKERLDEDCLTELSVHYGNSKDEMKDKIDEVGPFYLCKFNLYFGTGYPRRSYNVLFSLLHL